MICGVTSTSTLEFVDLHRSSISFKQSPKIRHETIFTTTGEPYSCWLNQWTKVSSIGFATTDPTVQTPAASTPEVPGPADAIAR